MKMKFMRCPNVLGVHRCIPTTTVNVVTDQSTVKYSILDLPYHVYNYSIHVITLLAYTFTHGSAY